jgi:hypothetical protein
MIIIVKTQGRSGTATCFRMANCALAQLGHVSEPLMASFDWFLSMFHQQLLTMTFAAGGTNEI